MASYAKICGSATTKNATQLHHLSSRAIIGPMAGVGSKRHLWYHYFTMDRKKYEEYKARNKIKLRWDKEGRGPEMPMRNFQAGHPEDPELWGTMDREYTGTPRFGDGYYGFVYRENPLNLEKPPFLDRMMGKLIATMLWHWFLYNLYWNYHMLFGHFYIPYRYEFSDEELGVPPDDAPDPEPEQYWGTHKRPYRSYR